jgi:hypothetical protein
MSINGAVQLTVLSGDVVVRAGELVPGARGGTFVAPDRSR